jgi:hypothetical protein
MGFLLIVSAIFFFDKNTPFPSVYALAPTVGAALIILFAHSQTLVGKLLGSQTFVGIGLVSYSAYLWHQPLFAFARHRSLNEPSQWILALLAFSSFALAYLSWRFVETPFRNKRHFNRKTIFIYGISGSLIFVAIGLMGHFTKGYFYRTSDDALRIISAAANETGKNSTCWGLITENKSLLNTCQLGVENREKSFAVVGDSHAGSLVDELNSAALSAKVAGFDYSYNSCPPLLRSRSKKQDSVQIACNGLREDFFRQADEQKSPKTLVLLARWTIKIEKNRFNNQDGGIESGDEVDWLAADHNRLGYVAALRKNYIESVNFMLEKGHRVILVYPVPEMGWNIPTRLARLYLKNEKLTPADASTSYEVFLKRNLQTYEALDAIGEHSNLIRVKPEEILCNTVVANRCIAHLNGMPLYYDDDHLSNAGAKLVVAEIMKHIGQ